MCSSKHKLNFIFPLEVLKLPVTVTLLCPRSDVAVFNIRGSFRCHGDARDYDPIDRSYYDYEFNVSRGLRCYGDKHTIDCDRLSTLVPIKRFAGYFPLLWWRTRQGSIPRVSDKWNDDENVGMVSDYEEVRLTNERIWWINEFLSRHEPIFSACVNKGKKKRTDKMK